MQSGLPGLGYDDDDEVNSPYVRKKNGLPPKEDEEIAQNDPSGLSTLKAGKSADLMDLDITVSTSGDQTAIVPGDLQEQWKKARTKLFSLYQKTSQAFIILMVLFRPDMPCKKIRCNSTIRSTSAFTMIRSKEPI